MPAARSRLDRLFLAGWLGGSLLVGGIGALLVATPLTRTLEHWSFDLPFLLRGDIAMTNILVIHFDAESAERLGGQRGQPPDRRDQTRLLTRLTDQGATAVFLDFVFRRPAADARIDAEFAAAMRRHGKVVLAEKLDESSRRGTGAADYGTQTAIGPNDELRSAAAGVGLIDVDLTGANASAVIRHIPLVHPDFPSAPTVIAGLLGMTNVPPPGAGWLNYRCPPWQLPSIPFHQALSSEDVFARGKIVLVGVKPSSGHFENDQFATPFNRVAGTGMPGVELHAHWLDNLLRRGWLESMPMKLQLGLVGGFALMLVVGNMTLRPGLGLAFSALAAAGVAGGSVMAQWQQNVWWPWLVSALVQAPMAWGWSVGYRYLIAEKRRRRFRQAFAHYLSPEIAARIDENRLSLEPGNGVVCEATVLFTDLKGYSAIAESLSLPEVGQLLSAYYEQITGAILRREGTIIKYVGDSVMAVWGAPVEDAKHAQRAVEAALEIAESNSHRFRGHQLRTRLGLCTGPVLAGNLGSSFRFDYTAIGNTTNTAARLEGLNKQLGTSLLIAESTAAQLGGEFLLRPVGRFIPAGKQEAVAVCEVIGRDPSPGSRPEWIVEFESAHTAWLGGDFARAKVGFERVVTLRDGHDGPSTFYLAQLSHPDHSGAVPAGWTGEIVLSAK